MATKRTKLPYWKDRKNNEVVIQESEQEFISRIKTISAKLDKFLEQNKLFD